MSENDANPVPIRWGADGLVPVVTVDDDSGDVLMLAFMNAAALAATRATGEVHYWSRSRGELWHKGATSGHIQELVSIHVNCDRNSLLVRARQRGAVCHDGYASCYYRRLNPDNSLTVTMDRLIDPATVYGDPSSQGVNPEAESREEETPSLPEIVAVEEPAGSSLLTLSAEETVDLLFAAYFELANPAYIEHSGTSRLLTGPVGATIPRLADELEELAGVLDGTHRHRSFREDVLLEGSQCLYWSILPQVQVGQSSRLEPFQAPREPVSRLEAAVSLRAIAAAWRADPPTTDTLAFCTAAVYESLAVAFAAAGVAPIDVIGHDLASLQERPYLEKFFAAQSVARGKSPGSGVIAASSTGS